MSAVPSLKTKTLVALLPFRLGGTLKRFRWKLDSGGFKGGKTETRLGSASLLARYRLYFRECMLKQE